MPVLRNSATLLNRTTYSAEAADSGTWLLRPVDSDRTEDREQDFVLMLYAEQQGAGVVTLDLLTSFGDGFWAVIGRRTLPAPGAYLIDLRSLDDVPPYVRLRVTGAPPAGGGPPPNFRVYARVASPAAFTAIPAKVPSAIERALPGEGIFAAQNGGAG